MGRDHSARQPSKTIVGQSPNSCRSISVLCLVLFLVGLAPLAEARPPDPLWIAGIYNAEDLDDVVEAILSVPALLGEPPLHLVKQLVVVAVHPGNEVFVPLAPRSAFHSRAPPRLKTSPTA